MANTRATLTGIDSRRIKEASRLGSVACEASVATWRTFIDSRINADGSGYVSIKRDGVTMHYYELAPENIYLGDVKDE